ncbi:hypothetical protein Tco_1004762 [Tanacetum coccineum]|uniref:Uncharacterized protein n=1 Tax=Tanacetum coccineum TaxID=301880 RepID=A0ABQ5FDI2_9ASTR
MKFQLNNSDTKDLSAPESNSSRAGNRFTKKSPTRLGALDGLGASGALRLFVFLLGSYGQGGGGGLVLGMTQPYDSVDNISYKSM